MSKPQSITGRAQGRPVGVAVDGRGALLVADDVGDVVWRVTPTTGVQASGAGPEQEPSRSP